MEITAADNGTGGGTTVQAGDRPRLAHLPALDGVRGAAVAAVLLFHAGYNWARGGYLGVTVFFVLSGFLITSLLLVERDTRGTVDLGRFWARRARRLAPALVVLVALVLLYEFVVAPRNQPGLVGDAVATLTWVANWRFVFAHRSYGDLFSQPSPFQHAWSLGVEEQFYLVLPLVAVGFLALRRARRLVFGAVVVVAIAASTAVAALAHRPGIAGGHAYYGTDARMAEPLVGVLLALVLVGPDGPKRLGRRAAAAVGLAGLAGVGVLIAMVATLGERSDTLYRGGFLAAALATAAVVAAATQRRSIVAQLLGFEPLAALGRISYGVYLYHWPIFLWLTARRTGLGTGELLAARVLTTLTLATVSYVVIERPIRAGRFRLGWLAFGWANASTALVAGLVAVASAAPAGANLLSGMGATAPAPPPPVVSNVAQPATPGAAAPPTAAGKAPIVAGATARRGTAPSQATASPSTTRPAAAKPRGSGNLSYGPSTNAPPPPTTSSGPGASSSLKVAVVGDSMALNLATGLSSWAHQRGDVVVYDLSIPGCPLSRGGTRRLPDGTDFEVKDECGWWNDPTSDRSQKLTEFAPDIVVVQDGMNEVPDRKLPSWSSYQHAGQPTFDGWLLGEYRSALKVFTAGNAKVVFLNTICADWETVGGGWADYAENSDGDNRVAALNRVDQAVAVTGVQVANYDAEICPNGKFSNTVEGVQNARPDGYHLSQDACVAVADKWLGPLIIQQAGPRPSL